MQDYWEKAFGTANGGYQATRTILFQGGVQTGCGNATSAVGPFYCPTDGLVYMDVGFFDELSSRFGAQGGPLAQAYVVAHEYGHHVQNLLGTSDRVGRDQATGPESGSVRLELQADCYAGVWTKNASRTTDAQGRALIKEPTEARDQGRAGRRRGGRRRPDPAAHPGPGQSRRAGRTARPSSGSAGS